METKIDQQTFRIISEESLTASRNEMYRSLELFLAHVKHTISLMFTLMTAVFAIFAIALRDVQVAGLYMPIIKLLGGTIILLLFPLGILSIIIIHRYYRMYCASLFFAADMHARAKAPLHLYLREVEEHASGQEDSLAKLKELVSKRTSEWPRSWSIYALLIAILSLAGLLCGSLILFSI